MKRQQIPVLLMLVAGAITSLTVYFRDLGLKTMLIALLATLVIFYFLGTIIKMIFDAVDEKNEKRVSDEGEVIEKEADEDVSASQEENEEEA